MKQILRACALVCVLAGCKSIEVDRRGQSLAFDKNGEVVKNADGNPLVLDKGWNVDYFQHWQFTKFDDLMASIKPDDIQLKIGGYTSSSDTNLVALVEKSLSSLGELAVKIGTTISTSRGITQESVPSIISLAKRAYELFTSSGGDESKAQVLTQPDGTITISDGTHTILCKDGVCSPQ